MAQADPSFSGVGDLPGGLPFSQARAVSDDGDAVAVYSETTARREAARWRREMGLEGLGALSNSAFSDARAMSGDGSVIVGESMSEAFRWTEATGMVGLGDLPGGATFSRGLGVSSDGSVVVGQSFGLKGAEAFMWSESTGMVGLSDLPGSAFSSIANGVSPDGSVVVGHGLGVNGFEAFMWSEDTGMVGLGDLPGAGSSSTASDASEFGEVIVGRGVSTNGLEAFRLTSADGMVGLGDLPGGQFSSYAFAVSADGSTIVGYGMTSSGKRAVIWRDGATQPELLSDVLVNEFGLDISGWTLEEALDVSDDGLVIVGVGRNQQGWSEGWIADLRVAADLVIPEDVVVDVWPPNGKMKSIDVMDVTDIAALNEGSMISVVVDSITQDEPVLGNGKGRPQPDGDGVGSDVARVRAERAGWGNGRVYEIRYTATSDSGATGEGVIRVNVAHDRAGGEAIDDGQSHDSTMFSMAGDVNVDGLVDGADLAALLSMWRDDDPLLGDAIAIADFNMDGRVNMRDLNVVLKGMEISKRERKDFMMLARRGHDHAEEQMEQIFASNGHAKNTNTRGRRAR
jgi:uncharacterized membrane protein